MALDDRDRIFDYYEIDQDNPRPAVMVDERIAQQIEVLIDHPEFGRPGRVDDTRELVISKTPYLVAYRILGDAVPITQQAALARRQAGTRPLHPSNSRGTWPVSRALSHETSSGVATPSA